MRYILITLFSLGLGFGASNWYERTIIKPHDEIVIDSFRIGCEMGVLQKCSPKDMDSCKRMCQKIIIENKDIIRMLKVKKE